MSNHTPGQRIADALKPGRYPTNCWYDLTIGLQTNDLHQAAAILDDLIQHLAATHDVSVYKMGIKVAQPETDDPT